MNKTEMEYTIINNSVSTLAILCAGDAGKITDLLTGYLWDEEEAGGIKALQQVDSSDPKSCGRCGGTGKFTMSCDAIPCPDCSGG